MAVRHALIGVWQLPRQSLLASSWTPIVERRSLLCQQGTFRNSTCHALSGLTSIVASQDIHLDSREPKDARFLLLQPFVDLVGIVTVDIGLFHEWECDAVVERAKLFDPLVIFWLSTSKLLTQAMTSFRRLDGGKLGRLCLPGYKGTRG